MSQLEYSIPRLMLAAPSSGSGKTTVTCALLRAAERHGYHPCAFKCGPDYIDPMFHRSVLGIPSRNLDLFFQDEESVRQQLAAASQRHGMALLEGVMGYYDGIGGTERASSWAVAQATRTPVVLVVEPKGVALTLSAAVKGLAEFRQPSQVVGVLLNGCSEKMAGLLAPQLERETSLAVFGFLPKRPEWSIASRNLGLLTPDEVEGLAQKVEGLAEQLERSVDLDALWRAAHMAPPLSVPPKPPACVSASSPVVAVAQDAAFCFYYEDNLDLLSENGLRLVPFSPLKDQALPDGTCGLYLGGGYPELHVRALSENESMRTAVRQAAEGGMPILAECGGFLYLQDTLEGEDGQVWPMAQVLHGVGQRTRQLQRFGYITVQGTEKGGYLPTGEQIAAHEFHRWDCTQNGTSCQAIRPIGGERWPCMVQTDRMLAGFPHLYYPSNPKIPARFARVCGEFKESQR